MLQKLIAITYSSSDHIHPSVPHRACPRARRWLSFRALYASVYNLLQQEDRTEKAHGPSHADKIWKVDHRPSPTSPVGPQIEFRAGGLRYGSVTDLRCHFFIHIPMGRPGRNGVFSHRFIDCAKQQNGGPHTKDPSYEVQIQSVHSEHTR